MSLSVRRMITWLLKLRGGGGFLLLNVKCLSVRQVYCFFRGLLFKCYLL